jgi:hypothetical protein
MEIKTLLVYILLPMRHISAHSAPLSLKSKLILIIYLIIIKHNFDISVELKRYGVL